MGVAAHTSHSASALTINAFTIGTADNYVYGAVSSPNSRCVAGRKVRVFRKTQGSDSLLGADVSLQSPSGTGPYTVTAPTGDLPEGRYYSEMRKRDLRPGNRHTHRCSGATSDRLSVGP